MKAPDVEDMLEALTGQFPNYAERLAERLGCPESEFWMLYLAAGRSMLFVGVNAENLSTLRARVPDQQMEDGRTRHQIWRAGLLEVLGILGDPEAHHRTGWNSAQLRQAVDSFFGP